MESTGTPVAAICSRSTSGRDQSQISAAAPWAPIRRIRSTSGRSVCTISAQTARRSEEHTSELQSRGHLVCRLLLAKKKKLVAAKIQRKKAQVMVCQARLIPLAKVACDACG